MVYGLIYSLVNFVVVHILGYGLGSLLFQLFSPEYERSSIPHTKGEYL